MSHNNINTTQNVNLDYPLADLGSRIGAYIIDNIILFTYIFLIFIIGLMVIPITNWDDYSAANPETIFTILAIITILMLPAFTYSLWAPYLMQGQTFGKKILKIKIVKVNGEAASFSTYLIRWLLNLIDFSLATPILALIVAAITPKRQRIADLVADTVVIQLKQNVQIPAPEIQENYQPKFHRVLELSDKDMQIINTSFKQAKHKKDIDTLQKLRVKIESVINEYKSDMTDIEYIETVIKDYSYYSMK